MALASYRLYCEECDEETVVAKREKRRDTKWKVGSLVSHSGLCPKCNPACEERHVDYIEFEELDNIGATAAENLREAGFKTARDIEEASDDAILDVAWVGEAGLTSIKERIKALPPQQRWEDE